MNTIALSIKQSDAVSFDVEVAERPLHEISMFQVADIDFGQFFLRCGANKNHCFAHVSLLEVRPQPTWWNEVRYRLWQGLAQVLPIPAPPQRKRELPYLVEVSNPLYWGENLGGRSEEAPFIPKHNAGFEELVQVHYDEFRYEGTYTIRFVQGLRVASAQDSWDGYRELLVCATNENVPVAYGSVEKIAFYMDGGYTTWKICDIEHVRDAEGRIIWINPGYLPEE